MMGVDVSINPWKVLGVHRGSTLEEVKVAYRDLMKANHPDAGGTQQAAAEITQCYKALTSPVVLKSYLDTLNVLGTPCQPCKGRGFTYKSKGLTDRVTTACTCCGGRGILVKGGL